MEYLLLFASCVTSAGLLLYSAHGWTALVVFLLARRRRPGPAAIATATPGDRVPAVTTQIYVGDDGPTNEQLLRAAATMIYPSDRHEIQVLDDSGDRETQVRIDRATRELRRRGARIAILRRRDRRGGKAGALSIGLQAAAGELVAVMDPELLPPPDFLVRTVPHFLQDDELGVVQVAARHAAPVSRPHAASAAVSDRGASNAPRLSSVHAEHSTGAPPNLSRWVGVWRRDAICDAGGWEGDTLAEQLELCYRAQIRGWRAHHAVDLEVRATPPASVTAFASDQFCWAKGSMQAARKLLPRIWRAPAGLRLKVRATLHLTHPAMHPLMLVSALLTVPSAASVSVLPEGVEPAVLALMAIALLAPHALYLATQRILYPRWWRLVASFPALFCVGVGVAVSNSRAVWEGLTGLRPERGRIGSGAPAPGSSRGGRALRFAWIEVTVGAHCAVSLGLYLSTGRIVLAPLLFAYAVGFLVTGIGSLHEWQERRADRLRRLLRGRRIPVSATAMRGWRPRQA